MTANHTCPRRVDDGMDRADGPHPGGGQNLDSYVSRSGLANQTSGCSYCGSLNPDEFMDAVRSGKEIGPTDKGYKFYVDAHLAKFYTQHLSEDQGWEFDQLWDENKINWGPPGAPYVLLFIPGPSTKKLKEEQEAKNGKKS